MTIMLARNDEGMEVKPNNYLKDAICIVSEEVKGRSAKKKKTHINNDRKKHKDQRPQKNDTGQKIYGQTRGCG